MNRQSHHIPVELSNLLKLLACIVICLHHYSQYGLDMHHISGPVYEVLRSVGGDLSVTLFFFLSGYGLMYSESRRPFDLKRFAVKRFWRILEPFWLVNLFAVIIYLILGVDNIATKSPLNVVASIFGVLRFDPTMWFIHYLLVIYILFGIGMWLRRPVLVVGGGIIAFIVIAVINRLPSHLWSSLFAFPFGMIVGASPDATIRFFRRYEILFVGLILYAALMYCFVFDGQQTNGPLWHQLNNILLVVLLLFVIGRTPLKYMNWYKLPSKWQPYYEVYLVHPKILFVTLFSFGIFIPLWIFLPLTFAIALVFCNIPSVSEMGKLAWRK